jgi:hypothetical protein
MKNNLYEIDFRNLEALYVLAADKYRALELVGDYLRESELYHPLEEGQYVIRQLDASVEQILRPERCHECPLNE